MRTHDVGEGTGHANGLDTRVIFRVALHLRDRREDLRDSGDDVGLGYEAMSGSDHSKGLEAYSRERTGRRKTGTAS